MSKHFLLQFAAVILLAASPGNVLGAGCSRGARALRPGGRGQGRYHARHSRADVRLWIADDRVAGHRRAAQGRALAIGVMWERGRRLALRRLRGRAGGDPRGSARPSAGQEAARGRAIHAGQFAQPLGSGSDGYARDVRRPARAPGTLCPAVDRSARSGGARSTGRAQARPIGVGPGFGRLCRQSARAQGRALGRVRSGAGGAGPITACHC